MHTNNNIKATVNSVQGVQFTNRFESRQNNEEDKVINHNGTLFNPPLNYGKYTMVSEDESQRLKNIRR